MKSDMKNDILNENLYFFSLNTLQVNPQAQY